MKTRCLIFEKPFTCAIREAPLPEARGDRLLVAARCSAISAGTEMLVFQGRFPPGMALDAALPGYAGKAFSYPLAYGYSSVGRVVAAGPRADAAWVGRRVFAFQAHQSHFVAPAAELIPVPNEVADEDAVFLAAMETAVNLVMDGRPIIGERVMLRGEGVLGLLTTAVLARFPLAALAVVERWSLRRRAALDMGAEAAWSGNEKGWAAEAAAVFRPQVADGGADLIFEMSGQPALLDTAMVWAGFGGRIVVGSWYGTKTAPIALGGRFHRNRLRLISSQVSTIAPELSGRWSKQRRLAAAWDLIARVRPSRLVTHRYPIEDVQQAYEQVAERPRETLQVLLTYQGPGKK
jgi:2-desacetyl-2-hydroxyethyl bacteriochlorophyllide A dehydrogenase